MKRRLSYAFLIGLLPRRIELKKGNKERNTNTMSKCQGEKVLCNTTFPFNANNSGTHASGNQPPIVNTPTDSNTGGEPKIDQRTFPEHLMDIIEEETRDGYGILEWAAGGESFVIRDKLKLETEVLPRYFHTKCKYMSFFRKLYRWGFRQREKNSPDNNLIFYNKYFKRGDKKQCLQLRSIVKRPSPTVASRAAVKSSSTTANRSCNLTEIPNDLHVVHNGILNNSPQFQNEILTSLQLQGSGAGVMSISSFASRQDGIGNNFGLPSLGNTGNNQMHMSMLSNTHHHQQQQQQHPEVMSSVYNRDSDDNWFPTRAAFATNWFNALENSSLHITRNTDGNTMNNDIGNNFSNDLNSNNKFANFSIMFPTGNRNNQRGMLPMDFLRASISNFSSVRTDQIQTQHDMYNRYCFNSQSSPTQGSYTFGNNSYSGGGNSNNNVGPY